MDTAQQIPQAMPLVDEASLEFLGRWNKLVSLTNWEKGRIICAWRDALVTAGAPMSSYTDEEWSRRVGNVSPQHVGRLRRVHERFGGAEGQYPGLYWSHFQAVLDWDDGEMWLEGASQNGWSIAEMRRQRWVALGGSEEAIPTEEPAAAAELDEDASPAETASDVSQSFAEVHGTLDDEPEAGSPFDADGESALVAQESVYDTEVDTEAPAVERPFENLAQLPDDLNEAFDRFRLAILSHKLTGWSDVALDDVLSALDALKRLALAPPGD